MSLISQNVASNTKLKVRKEANITANLEYDEFDDKKVKKSKKVRGTKSDSIGESTPLTIDLTPASALFADKDASNLSKVTDNLKPAWEDDADGDLKVNLSKVNRLRKLRNTETETEVNISNLEKRLRAQFTKINPTPIWAQSDTHLGASSDDDSSDNEEKIDDILRSNEELTSKTQKLLPGILSFSQGVDANVHGPSIPPITSTQFHSNGRLLAVAGPKSGLAFYDIDGKHNTSIESFQDKEFPIQKAAFLPNSSRVLITAKRNFFCVFDLDSGNVSKGGPLVGREERTIEKFSVSSCTDTIAFAGDNGYILLVSSKTLELTGSLKMNGTVESLAFTKDGMELLSHGGDGHVYSWDLRTMTCKFKGVDDGCVGGTALCCSPLGDLFAAGSSSGIVNVYKRDEFSGGKRTPMKVIENLRTRVDCVKFNHDAQMLAICSYGSKNGLRLVHVPSYTVYSNWPSLGGPSIKPKCFDFSPGGGFLAVGNNGKVLLYRLHHYDRS